MMITNSKHISLFQFILVPVWLMLSSVDAYSGNFDRWEKVKDLSGEWKFTIGDNLSWSAPSYNDSDWEYIKVPSPWENEGFHGYNGYAWYRKSIDRTYFSEKDELYLFLGYIDDVDEVYVNGTLIGFSGSFPPRTKTAYNAFRRYAIPTGLLRSGRENVIAVRVYDTHLAGGIVSGDVGIYSKITRDPLDYQLAGLWRFRIGDRLSWRFNTTDEGEDWDRIMAPGYWEHQGYNYNGFAWYQRTVCLSEEMAGEDMFLLLGKIDDYDQVFINGEEVGATRLTNSGPPAREDGNAWQVRRSYFIPANTFKPDQENVISIRVFDFTGDGGIHEGPMGLVRIPPENDGRW